MEIYVLDSGPSQPITSPAVSTVGTLYCYCKQPEDGSEIITCDKPVCEIELPHHLLKNHCYS